MPTNWKRLFGNPVAGPEKRTPLGFRYQDNGFNNLRPNRVTKVLRWLENRKVPPDLIAEYLLYANLFITDEQYIPKTIDAAFNEMKAKYLACGGKWADAARRINSGQIRIIVEPAPVWSQEWNTDAVGLAWGSRNLIQAVCVAMNGVMKNPTQAGPLRKFSDLMVWEWGNYLSFKAGHRIKTLADEKGSDSPCAIRSRATLPSEMRQTSSINP